MAFQIGSSRPAQTAIESQVGPGQLHAVTEEDPFLAVQRQVVGILADGHVGQQSWTGKPLLDRLGEPLGDDDVPFAGLAGVLGPHVLDDDQAGRHVLELLADLLADFDPQGAAVGTRELVGGDVVDFTLARQACGQWLAAVPLLLAWTGRSRSWRRVGRRCVGQRRGFGGRGFVGRQDLACKEQELSGIELLGLAAITLAQELFELVLEFLVEVSLLGERLQELANELMAGLEIGG